MKPLFCQCCERIYESPEDFLKGTSRFRVCPKSYLWFECSCGSGLIMKKGEYEWYSPTLKMSKAAATIFKEVQEIKNIPLIPTSILTLQNVISDDKSSSGDIKKALKDTPHIAMGVMRKANILRASYNPEFTSLEHAISFIGRQTLSDLVLAESLQLFDFKTHHFNKDDFWQESLLTGKIAEALATQYAPSVSKDEAYLAGSLCNVGKVISAICFPNITDDVARSVSNPLRPKSWTQGEDSLRAISHVVLGEVAGALWGFPEYIIHAIAYHHTVPKKVGDISNQELEFLDAESAPKIAVELTRQQIVALANQFAHWILLQPTRMDEPFLEQYTNLLKLDDKARIQLADSFMHLKEELAA